MLGNMGGSNPTLIDPALISQVMQMARTGADIKTIVLTLKRRGLTPDVAEQVLCMAFPPLRQIRDQIKNSGMNPQQYFMQIAKQNHISEEQAKQTIQDLNTLFR